MIDALTALDGRYAKLTKDLAGVFSEYGLIKYRVFVEIEWLKFIITDLKLVDFDEGNIPELDRIAGEFSLDHARKVKEIEKKTNHDVKAVEYFIKDCLDDLGFSGIKEWVHFACTSDDINNSNSQLLRPPSGSVPVLTAAFPEVYRHLSPMHLGRSSPHLLLIKTHPPTVRMPVHHRSQDMEVDRKSQLDLHRFLLAHPPDQRSLDWKAFRKNCHRSRCSAALQVVQSLPGETGLRQDLQPHQDNQVTPSPDRR